MTGDHIRIVNEHGPDVHADEGCEVVFLNGVVVVVGERLGVTVVLVESVGGERGTYNLSVARPVSVPVGVVFQSADLVDVAIGTDEEPVGRTLI